MHWIRDGIIIIALGWLLLVALTTVQAQEPTPDPSLQSFCEAASIEGGGTRIIGWVEVTLPPGTYNWLLPPPGTGGSGESNFVLCHKETGGILNMNAANCAVNSRTAPSAEAETVLDAIVASCRVAPTPTPEPTPTFACAAGEAYTGGGSITIGGNLVLTLPAGNFIISVNENNIAQICNVDEEYSAYLNVSDCTSPVIMPPNDPHQEAIQEIRASCTTLAPTPTPDSNVVIIQPPSTGDAGLATGRP